LQASDTSPRPGIVAFSSERVQGIAKAIFHILTFQSTNDIMESIFEKENGLNAGVPHLKADFVDESIENVVYQYDFEVSMPLNLSDC
jgi:hypothetical protein